MSVFVFVINSILLGVGLAMDAFSVSIANGLRKPAVGDGEKAKIAGTFAGFQFLMPVIGWMFVHYLVETFAVFQKWIPWIAFALLFYIGGKMILEALHDENDPLKMKNKNSVSNSELIIQGIATSIDALSVGFTIADYDFDMAVICSLIIAIVTFIICEIGLTIGIKVGNGVSKKASVFGGIILVFIGVEIIVKSLFL